MRISVTIPERIGREAERLALEEGTPVATFFSHALEEYVKEACRKKAIEQLDALLESPAVKRR